MAIFTRELNETYYPTSENVDFNIMEETYFALYEMERTYSDIMAHIGIPTLALNESTGRVGVLYEAVNVKEVLTKVFNKIKEFIKKVIETIKRAIGNIDIMFRSDKAFLSKYRSAIITGDKKNINATINGYDINLNELADGISATKDQMKDTSIRDAGDEVYRFYSSTKNTLETLSADEWKTTLEEYKETLDYDEIIKVDVEEVRKTVTNVLYGSESPEKKDIRWSGQQCITVLESDTTKSIKKEYKKFEETTKKSMQKMEGISNSIPKNASEVYSSRILDFVNASVQVLKKAISVSSMTMNLLLKANTEARKQARKMANMYAKTENLLKNKGFTKELKYNVTGNDEPETTVDDSVSESFISHIELI